MKVEQKESSPCVISLTVKTEAEEVKAEYKKVLDTFLREAEVPGFRKGKTPLAVIQRKFADGIKQETLQACFHAIYPKALKEANLDPIELQNVADAAFSVEDGFSFTALVEVAPKFDLPKYKKLAVQAGDTAVTDEQVTERIENYRRAFAKFNDAKPEEVIAEGDFVRLDYTGVMDNKAKQPLSEIIPEEKAVCGAVDFWTQIEEGRFLPELLDALKGMKAGETKADVKVKFPKDNAPEAIKGKKALYTVTVKAFRRRELPDDAAFVTDAKVASMDELRANFRKDMEAEAVEKEREDRKTQAITLLLKKSEFDVPPSLIRRQTESFLQDLARNAQYNGMTADYIEKNRDKILADAQDHAVKQVRLSYILDGIAKEEKIEISDDEMLTALGKIAEKQREKVTAEDLRKRLEANGQTAAYKEQLAAEKALEFVLAQAK